jgi:hypothetical protein
MRGECRIAKTSVESHSTGTIPLLTLHASRFVLRSGIGAVQSRVRGSGTPSGQVEQNAFLQAAPGRWSMQDNVAMPLIVTALRLAIRPTSQGQRRIRGIKSSGGHGRPSRQCGMSTTANCRDITTYRLVLAPRLDVAPGRPGRFYFLRRWLKVHPLGSLRIRSWSGVRGFAAVLRRLDLSGNVGVVFDHVVRIRVPAWSVASGRALRATTQ